MDIEKVKLLKELDIFIFCRKREWASSFSLYLSKRYILIKPWFCDFYAQEWC